MLIDIPKEWGVYVFSYHIKPKLNESRPDGGHIDSEGNIWTALSGGKNIVAVIDPGDRSAGAGKIIKELKVDTLYLVCSF